MSERIRIGPGNRAAWARGAWLATTLALGAALVAGSWANYRGAKAAAETLNRGHVEVLEHAVRQALERTGPGEEAEALRDVLETHAEAGLRYVAFLEADGSVIISAGEPLAQVEIPAGYMDRARDLGIVMVSIDDRLRAFLPRGGRSGGGFGFRSGPAVSALPQVPALPTPGGEPVPDRNVTGEAEPDRMGGEAARRLEGDSARAQEEEVSSPWAAWEAARQRQSLPPQGYTPPDQLTAIRFRTGGMGHTLIEFEPVVASHLVAQSGRSLGLGSLGAALLTLAALIFWRQSVRYESTRRDLEQKQRLSQIGEMSAVLAHEIRNPLASLKGNAQLLAERLPAGSRDRAKAERVVSEASRLEDLTTDLLEFARSGPIETQAVDPAAVARHAVDEVAPDGFHVDTLAAPAAWPLDPDRLRHALINVLENARQASPPGVLPRVTVLVGPEGLAFEVRDYGSGLPPGGEHRLFDPFFTTRTNGTGLGLAVARRAAEFHGGTITAHNHPEGGAVFRILIPPAAG